MPEARDPDFAVGTHEEIRVRGGVRDSAGGWGSGCSRARGSLCLRTRRVGLSGGRQLPLRRESPARLPARALWSRLGVLACSRVPLPAHPSVRPTSGRQLPLRREHPLAFPPARCGRGARRPRLHVGCAPDL